MRVFGTAVVFLSLAAFVAPQLTITLTAAAVSALNALGVAAAGSALLGGGLLAGAALGSRRRSGFRNRYRSRYYYRGRRYTGTADVPLDCEAKEILERALGLGDEPAEAPGLGAESPASRVEAIMKEDQSGCVLQFVCYLASPCTNLSSEEGQDLKEELLAKAKKTKEDVMAPRKLLATDDIPAARLVGQTGGDCNIPKCVLKSEVLVSEVFRQVESSRALMPRENTE